MTVRSFLLLMSMCLDEESLVMSNKPRSKIRPPEPSMASRDGAGVEPRATRSSTRSMASRREALVGARAAAALVVSCVAMASFAGCHGDSKIPQVEQVAQVGQQQTYVPPDPAHVFTDLAPAAHILPATARDYLPGSGEVGADGAYHYALPLEVPPGRGDVTPQLSLGYSSRSGNGPLGVGWNVGGLSTIHPCDAIVATDGIAAEGDRLCLDGALMVQIGAFEFRTENDMIAKIVRLGDSDFNWKVYLKDHRIRYYGRTYSSDGNDDKVHSFPLAEEHDRSGNIARYLYKDTAPPLVQSIQYTFHSGGAAAQREIVFNYKARPDPIARRVSGEAFRWDELVDTIVMKAPNPDAKATVWTYSLGYETSPDTGYSRLTTVARCGAAGGCSYAREFDYSRWSEFGGERFEDKVTSFPGDPLDPASPMLVADVDGDGDDDVVYQDATGQHRIHIGAGELPLSGSFDVSNIGFMGQSQPVDIDGDGASEIAVLVLHGTEEDIEEADTAAEFQALYHYEIWRWNKDALDFELVPGVLPPNAATVAPDAYTDPTCRFGDIFGACDHLFFADLNGDMLPDIVKPWDASVDGVYQPTSFEIYINIGGTFGPPATLPLALAPHQRLAYHTWFHATVRDGRHFVRYLRYHDCASCTLEYDSWIVGLRADGTAETLPFGDDPWHDGTTGPKPTDMDPDGDGVRELRWLAATDPWYPSHLIPIRADIDGDGREDVVLHDKNADTISILLSKTLANSSAPVYALSKTLTHNRDLAKVVTGDFDGDGRVDIAGIESGADSKLVIWPQFNEWQNVGIATFDVDLLISVRDTDGAFLKREDIVYRNDTPTVMVSDVLESANAPAAAADCSSSYPVVCMNRGITVVAEHATYKPTMWAFPSERRTRYSYFYPYIDALGRGFLGFQMIRSWEPELAVESEVHFRNTDRVVTQYPFAFIPSSTLTTTLILDVELFGQQLPESTALARVVKTDHSLTYRALNGGQTYVVNKEITTELEWEEDVEVVWDPTNVGMVDYLGGVVTPQSAPRMRTIDPTFDDYGNVIAQVATTEGGVRSEFTLGYETANTTSWLVDLPKDYRFRSWTPSLHNAPSYRHVRFQHDPQGRLTTQWIEPTSTDDDIKQTITYERDPAYGSYGQVTGVTRTAPGVVEPRFIGVDWHDWTGEQIFPSREWNGLAHTTTFVHHPAYGLLLAEANPDGVETLYQYDDLGRPRGKAVEGGDSVELTYAERMGLTMPTLEVTATTASGDVRSTVFDKVGRPTMRTVRGMDGNVKQMTMTYNVLGYLHGRSNWNDGLGNPPLTQHWYDTLGRPRRIDRPGGTEIETTYPGQFEATHHDAKGAAKRQVVDKDGRLIETYAVVDGVEVLSSQVVYKPFDLPGITRDADDNATELFYDQLGRRIREEDPNAGTTRLFYNGFGEIRRAERGTGTVDATVMNRDVLGRIHTMNTVGGIVTLTWDAPNGTGKLDKEFSADGMRVVYSYDEAGRVSGSRWWKGDGSEWFDLDVERDEYGRVIKTIYPQANGQRLTIANVYDGAYVERVEDVTDPANPERLWTITERAADGALSAGEFGDGLAYYAAQYDEMGQPTRLQAYRSPSDYLMDIEYTPDANGNVERREDHVVGRVETFGYDELHRLRQWTNTRGATSLSRSFVYDRIGNLEKVLSGATVLEEFVDRGVAGPQKLDHSTGGVTYDYDHRGRQTRAGNRTIVYNAFDLPRQVTQGGTTWYYQYTASGERFREVDSLGFLERIYVGGLYERYGQTHIHHVHGPDGPVADIIVNASGRRVSYVVPDALGSTAVRFDETLAPGAAPERFHYEPFGRRIGADGSAWAGSWGAQTLGFAGVEQARLGLIQMGGRAYDPVQRRFLSPDPLVSDPYFDQARHRYSYVHNNPATLTDPTGYSPGGPWGPVPPAWLCGYVSPIQLSFGAYSGGSPLPQFQPRASLPDVTPDSYRSATPAGPQYTGPGYAGGDRVARMLIDYGVDAWLQENGDTAINVSLGVSYVALTVATYGMAAEAGVFAAMSARVASFGATSSRAVTGVAGVVGEGARRYGNQVTRWGAQISSAGRAARGAPELGGFARGISVDEIQAINRGFGGSTTLAGHPSAALAAAARQQGFFNKAAAMIRDIAGGHMFDDANKRTALAVYETLATRNGIMSGVSNDRVRAVIGQVARRELRTIEEIAARLRGY
ncbi:RHS repeat-associated core domain-containing protein [Sorangium sp. So ce176]|uniref:RHS repeat-associated core domain-containing protein n=1 Tax=Sorangium sp. So ce176 TaxID=3133286 RepID=UPI003F63EEF5